MTHENWAEAGLLPSKGLFLRLALRAVGCWVRVLSEQRGSRAEAEAVGEWSGAPVRRDPSRTPVPVARVPSSALPWPF